MNQLIQFSSVFESVAIVAVHVNCTMNSAQLGVAIDMLEVDLLLRQSVVEWTKRNDMNYSGPQHFYSEERNHVRTLTVSDILARVEVELRKREEHVEDVVSKIETLHHQKFSVSCSTFVTDYAHSVM